MKLGPVTVVPGASLSVFPFCTSLLVDGGRERAVIDPGAGKDALLAALPAGGITHVIDTHYHFDHIWGNHFFPEAAVLLNEAERECFPDLEAIAARLGVREVYGAEGAADWIRAVAAAATAASSGTAFPQAPYTPAFRPEWWLSTRRLAGAYPYGEFRVGSVRLVMVRSPGHTAGLACPYFPDQGLVYTADIDLTRFGPWYAGTDGDVDSFAASVRALLGLDAEWYRTGHQEGLVRRAEFAERLEAYLGLIDERERRVLDLLGAGVPEDEVTGTASSTRSAITPTPGSGCGTPWRRRSTSPDWIPGDFGRSWMARATRRGARRQ